MTSPPALSIPLSPFGYFLLKEKVKKKAFERAIEQRVDEVLYKILQPIYFLLIIWYGNGSFFKFIS